MAKKVLTLNIGAAQVELAEYEIGAKGALTLVNFGVAALAAPLENGNAATVLTPAILEIVREKGIRPGPVAMSVSGQMVFPKFAAVPMAGGEEKFEQMIRIEVEQNIPFPIDEMVCDRQVLGDTEDGDKSVMIVAAKTEQIEELTSAVSSAGFSPEFVDVAPLSLVNALRHNRPEAADECAIILDIGAKTTSLVISEGDKLYNRSIPVAGNSVTKEIANALGCDLDEAEQFKIANAYVSLGGVTEDDNEAVDRVAKVCRAVMTRLHAEISRSINFYRGQQKGGVPTRLYLTGGTALLPQIDVFFAESLGIEVEFFNPFERIATGPKIDQAAFEASVPLIAATAGVAVHAAEAARFAINLLPLSLIEERAEKAKIPFVVAGGVALIAALVLVMLAFGRQADAIAARRDAVAGKVSTLMAFDKKVKVAEDKLTSALSEATEFKKRLTARGAAVRQVNAVRNSLVKGMWIERWDDSRIVVRYWRDLVKTVSGKTPGETIVDKLKGKVSVIDPASVKIADMSAIGQDSQIEQVTVELKFK